MSQALLDPRDAVDLAEAIELALEEQGRLIHQRAEAEAAESRELAVPDPVDFSIEAGIRPDPWQAELLRSADPQVILNCSRQSGKSTTTATLAVHTALYQPNSLVLLISRALRQSSELFRKCGSVYHAVSRPVRTTSESALTVEFENKSRIVALPGNEATIRSFSAPRLIVIDEASRVPDALYYSVRPMLAISGGRLMLLSSPFGKRGFFYREWSEGGAAWRRFKVTAEQCPRYTPEFLVEERRAMPKWFYDQEYDCSFEDNVAQIFPTDLVLAAGSDALEPLFGMTTASTLAGDPALTPLFGAMP